ncbi:MAG: glycosyltransferase, partial [Planctomycetes bacterium]|nr:glycosyltransferase [Planctomycetota bacterium]
MIVAFDGICLGDGPPTGVARCFLDGLAAYVATGDATCLLLLPDGAPDPGLRDVHVVRAPRGAWRRQFGLPRLLRTHRVDVLHSSVASIPAFAPCPTIATVHDLPWLHPELGERPEPRLLARLVARAAAIVAPSTQTASDTRAWLGARCPPLHRVPHGTNPGPPPTEGATAARSGPLLVLGDDRPRKNRDRLRAAHTRARATVPDLPPLRFVGPPHDWVDEPAKHALLRDCRALVHVSLFEGFGLPVLEGLAHGTPVLCSDLPPHREIAGDAALFVEPRDVDAIAAGLVAIHRDAGLRARL